MALRESRMGYKFGKTGPIVNHLLSMDDIKLFAKNDNEIDSLVYTVRICNSDIGMEMGIFKMCTRNNEKRKTCEEVSNQTTRG